MVNILCFYGVAEMNFVALNSVTKECESVFDMYAWWLYFPREENNTK